MLFFLFSLGLSIAPNAGQDKAGRSDFSHYAIRASPGENTESADLLRDRKGTPKKLCGNDFTELSGELSGVICLKTLVLLASALDLFRKFFGAVRAILWLWFFFWPLIFFPST